MNNPIIHISQHALPGLSLLDEAVQKLANAESSDRGAIYTKREVVEFILDLTGYTTDKPLVKKKILEPSFGQGDFLLVIVERLLASLKNRETEHTSKDVANAICAVELNKDSYEKTKKDVIEKIKDFGYGQDLAVEMADSWLILGDFLLIEFSTRFDYVVGNPPYVRQELIPDALISEYRSRYDSIYDRADLYIPFIERSLCLLKKDRALGFICSDRWMKNKYGQRLRKLVAEKYHLHIYVDMEGSPAFNEDVIAYPAVVIIGNDQGETTRVSYKPDISYKALSSLRKSLLKRAKPNGNEQVIEVKNVASGKEPWILDSFEQLNLVRKIESLFRTIEEAGCKVGIGVATGADKAFIGPYDELDVEFDRKLPLAMTRDVKNGTVCWRGFGIVNPFYEDGTLIALSEYPKLKKYLENRKEKIAKRHIAKKAPANWYRTIDRIFPSLAERPKLLIPDIKGEANIVYENEGLYPHHNLYYIVSEEWDLKALQAVLRSGIAQLFVSLYSVKMRGGYLRYQAQYLRRICVPKWSSVPGETKDALIGAVERGDVADINDAVARLYGISSSERALLGKPNLGV